MQFTEYVGNQKRNCQRIHEDANTCMGNCMYVEWKYVSCVQTVRLILYSVFIQTVSIHQHVSMESGIFPVCNTGQEYFYFLFVNPVT